MTTIPSPGDIRARDKLDLVKTVRQFVIDYGTSILGGQPALIRVLPTQIDSAMSMFNTAGWECEIADFGVIKVLGKL
jgi:hypothetical protein